MSNGLGGILSRFREVFRGVPLTAPWTAALAMCASMPWVAARDLADLSIEELLNESVTSVSKREQRLADAAAAIAVLSNEDLRRAGVTSVAEALRLVPGVQVGAVNSSQWAISARGFNSLYANKLLVLVDGRAVYTPLWAGVYWDLQTSMLEDVDRIEVIRGPGATVWGANAVNGVINIVSRSARDTQGSLVFGGGGNPVERLGGVRQGGQLGEKTYYRVFAQHEATRSFPLANGQEAGDAWRRWSGGFRLDSYLDAARHFTWQGDLATTHLDEGASHARDANTLVRWTKELGEDSNVEAQAYYDIVTRDDQARSYSQIETFDFTLEHTFRVGERHAVISGVGHRSMSNTLAPTNPEIILVNRHFHLDLFSAFVQDEFQVVPDTLTLTGGVKVEENDFTGVEIQPSVRGVWKPARAQTVWAAISRAVRTPSALEDKNPFVMPSGAPIIGPDGGLYLPVVSGNGNPDAEVLWSHEVGWRVQPNPRVSIDLAAFYNRYESTIAPFFLTRFLQGTPMGFAEMPFTNTPEGSSMYGGEVAMTVAPTESWRVIASYSRLRARVPGFPQVDPEDQAVLRSAHDFGRFQLDVQMRYVGGFAFPITLTEGAVPSYVEADVRLAYRASDTVEFSIAGQNLIEEQHVEQGPTFYSITAEVPRRVIGKAAWRF